MFSNVRYSNQTYEFQSMYLQLLNQMFPIILQLCWPHQSSIVIVKCVSSASSSLPFGRFRLPNFELQVTSTAPDGDLILLRRFYGKKRKFHLKYNLIFISNKSYIHTFGQEHTCRFVQFLNWISHGQQRQCRIQRP